MSTDTSTATAPAYIARDTYAGRWTVTRRDTAHLGRRTAAEIAEFIGHGNVGVIWEFAGHTAADRALFCRTRFYAAADGSLHGFDSDGARKVIHPAGRVVGFLSATGFQAK